jgi:hypothetical protein
MRRRPAADVKTWAGPRWRPLQRMRNAVKLAESTAPTHPHPGVESATKNLLAGPFAAMLDRAKDAITGKS